MSTQPRYLIKFQQGDLAYLREHLLANLEQEQFALLLGKTYTIGGYTVMTVFDQLFPAPSDYEEQSVASLPTFRSLKTHFWIFSIALSTSFTGLLIYPEVLERERMIYFWYLYLIYMEIGR